MRSPPCASLARRRFFGGKLNKLRVNNHRRHALRVALRKTITITFESLQMIRRQTLVTRDTHVGHTPTQSLCK